MLVNTRQVAVTIVFRINKRRIVTLLELLTDFALTRFKRLTQLIGIWLCPRLFQRVKRNANRLTAIVGLGDLGEVRVDHFLANFENVHDVLGLSSLL